MHSTWSALALSLASLPARQAQNEGLTKCTVGMPAGLQPGFKAEVEIRGVDADEDIRWIGDQPGAKCPGGWTTA
jgi:hypothetical protein